MSARNWEPLAKRIGGWGTTEYVAVLLGLAAVWRGGQALLTLIREHHDEFAWAMTMPF